MPTIIYRCPNTGLKVQGWIADDPDIDDGENFEPVDCLACTQTHLVNPKTGGVLGKTRINRRRKRRAVHRSSGVVRLLAIVPSVMPNLPALERSRRFCGRNVVAV